VGRLKLDAKVRVEDCFEFDFDKHRKRGREQINEGRVQWKKVVSGEVLWEAEFWVTDWELRIYYVDPDGVDRVDEFPIEYLTTPVGGDRPYIWCPDCEARVRKVYAKDKWGPFRCRKCHDLIYTQQAERSSLQEEVRKMSMQQLLERMEKTTDIKELNELLNIILNYVSADTTPWHEVMLEGHHEA